MHRPAALLGLPAVVLALAGCGGSSSSPVAPAVAPLPAGALSQLVPQPAEVPTGLIVVAAQSGPASVDRLAGFASQPATAKAKLTRDGFVAAYVAEYATRGGRTLTVVVTRFRTDAGATSDLAGDLTGTTPVPGLGDEAGELTQPLPGGPAGGQLVTERFRVGALTYLVAAGGPQGVDAGDVRSVSGTLADRARKAFPG